ncbi:MAG: glucosaminidase domain-containing protein [Pseudomonadales bacterium]|nr:glucosaminidase domain-containing protein [Pseudomonadales bacterium]
MKPALLIICVLSICFSQLMAVMDKGNRHQPAPVLANPAPEPRARVVAPFHPRPVMLGQQGQYSPPDFSQLHDVQLRKQAFYDYMLPKIYTANQEISLEREWLLWLEEKLLQGDQITADELNDLAAMEKRYALSDVGSGGNIYERILTLMPRVDIVPASLVLAQAAKESGWGTSRFAREGNNFFGIWCFTQGCGLKPARRDAGRTHEVAVFDTVEEGVRYYIRTINTHLAYDDLRKIRSAARSNNEPFNGDQLATGLLRYSERGLRYVNEIRSMIRSNKLSRFVREYSA